MGSKTPISFNLRKYVQKQLKIGLLLVIYENFLSNIQKNNVLAICISYYKLKLNSLFSELFSYKVLRNSLIEQFFRTETTSVPLF